MVIGLKERYPLRFVTSPFKKLLSNKALSTEESGK